MSIAFENESGGRVAWERARGLKSFIILMKSGSGGSRKLKTGGAIPDYLIVDTPSYVLYLFVVRVENKVHIVNILHVDYNSSICVLCSQNLRKQTPFFLKRRSVCPVRRSCVLL